MRLQVSHHLEVQVVRHPVKKAVKERKDLMEDPEFDVVPADTETATESSPADQQTVETEETTEPVDEQGVPLKNRVAEQQRKARKIAAAQASIVGQTEPTLQDDGSQEDALRLVETIAEGKARKMIEPIMVRQFLYDNPDAADMVEDINRVRAQYPELASVDKLDVAFRIAKAERQDELLRIAEEKGRNETRKILETQGQAAIEGTGKVTAPTASLADRIANAKTPEELQALEQYLSK
jgi:hypothetical protein